MDDEFGDELNPSSLFSLEFHLPLSRFYHSKKYDF